MDEQEKRYLSRRVDSGDVRPQSGPKQIVPRDGVQSFHDFQRGWLRLSHCGWLRLGCD
jgi:hypothetical protein